MKKTYEYYILEYFRTGNRDFLYKAHDLIESILDDYLNYNSEEDYNTVFIAKLETTVEIIKNTIYALERG